jgi:rubrerythrin
MGIESIPAHMVGVEDLVVIRNLETAFEEESKNYSAYRAYATKAEEEDYRGIASLFRAIARAEQIHAVNHARVLRHMGGSTKLEIPAPVIEGTVANLLSALVDQKFEVAYLYPTFLTSAVPLFDSTAIRSFHWALEADKSHVRIFREAMRQAQDGGKCASCYMPHPVFVCALCGYAAQEPEAGNCPSCNYLWERFEIVR